VPQSDAFETEVATEIVRKCELPCINWIPAEMIVKVKTVRSDTHNIINSFWDMEELP
jgi:hypothetical protein